MSTITVAIVITEGFSTFHVSVPLILFGEILDVNAKIIGRFSPFLMSAIGH
ncbi:hypothetical protein MZG01_22005 [Escherichia coli]|nr:hypothetical protein [Escherichia coli]MCK2941603.1 hypothetical protein [Escherichia coli]